ncbi:MAG: hypothetical protein ACFFFG_04975 [Candidatus Thorarchaeota archaeon]
MRKIEIVEIENSFLNFFTPAIIIASGYFLINLISWPLSLLPWAANQANIRFDFNLLFLISPIVAGILVSLIVYFIFIPRLKVIDAEYKTLSRESSIMLLVLFCVAMSIRLSFGTLITEFLGGSIELLLPWYLPSYNLLFVTPLYLSFFLIGRVVIHGFTELIYRRTAIPSLEDRGLAPSHAVVTSSVGFILLDLSYYLNTPNLLSNIFWLGSTFIYAILTGLIYVFTRNVFYCFLYALIYDFYKLTDILGSQLNNDILNLVYVLISIFALAVGLITIIYITVTVLISRSKVTADWIKTLKKRSVPKVRKGLIGFIIIAFVLVLSQYLITSIISGVTQFHLPDYIVYHTIFFLVAFSIPFWLSITTEYARD